MAAAATDPSQSSPDTGAGLQRHRIARLVVLGAFLTIFLLVTAVIGIAGNDEKSAAAAVAEKTFNSILPVLAGWVGTVLAFYFSAQSLERTSTSLDKALSQAGATPAGGGATVSEKMIPYASIRERIDLQETAPEKILLSDLQEKFKTGVTRLVFVDKGVFRYLVHAATLNAFIVKRGTVEVPPATFADMLLDADTLTQISKLVVFVPANATLGEARTALASVAGAQDLIVTGTGNASGTMLGWITNVDLIKALTAG